MYGQCFLLSDVCTMFPAFRCMDNVSCFHLKLHKCIQVTGVGYEDISGFCIVSHSRDTTTAVW